MRPYRVTILDRDGEQHEYDFIAPTVWHVTAHIAATMQTERDFYGHKAVDTIEVHVTELYDMVALEPHPITVEG